jgi:hypothetical protein
MEESQIAANEPVNGHRKTAKRAVNSYQLGTSDLVFSDSSFCLVSTLIFPFYKMLFMNGLEFSCFADFFVRILKTIVFFKISQ